MINKKNIVIFMAFPFILSLGCQKRSSPDREVGNIGDPCTSDFDCRSGLDCAHSGTCQDPGDRQRGSAAEGESCVEEDCRYGLTCCDVPLHERRGCTINTCVRPGDEGDRCAGTEDCRFGLVCDENNECAPDGVGGIDSICATSEECAYQLVCGSEGLCKEAGEGGDGDPCTGLEECRLGLVCAGDGTCRDPGNPDSASHGIGGIGDECSLTADCRLGMTCFLDGTCQVPRYWPGGYCAPDDPADDFKIYFEVPSLPFSDELDFYRLPFPNDIRIRGGKVQLDGHPVPDVEYAGSAVSAYIDAIDDNYSGFSTQPTVFMRFSRSPDFGTVRLANVCETCENVSEDPPECPSGCAKWLFRNFYIVNITPPADSSDPDYMGYGEGYSFGMSITTGRSKYICQNSISLRTADGYPLRAGATYAVIVTDTANPAEGIRTDSGETLAKDDDFAKLIEGIASDNCAGAAEGDPDIENACRLPGYGWLSDYLGDPTQVDHDPNWQEHVRAAAVFTTMKPADKFAGFRNKVYDCTDGDCGYLPEATPEGFSENAALSGAGFKVYDGALRVPVFQTGTPPYGSEGGEIEYFADAAPRLVPPPSSDFSRVNLSMSLPDSTDMPAGGWPVVIYMHDVDTDPSGEAWHAFVANGAAQALSSVDVILGDPPAAETARFAVLSIEGVMHGNRRNSSAGPAMLYYNLMNPLAARDNVLQAAADGYQVIRFIRLVHRTFADGGSFPGLEGVDMDPGQIYLFARGEGARSGIIFTAFEPLVRAAVISQVGGPVTANLVRQTRPLDFPGALAVMVAEKNPGMMNPAVSLMQMLFDPVDPVNYGRFIIHHPPQIGETTDDPPEPVYAGPHHLFAVFGRDDPAAPESPMLAQVATFGIHQFDNDPSNCRCNDLCDEPGDGGIHSAVCSIGGMEGSSDDIRGNLAGAAVTGVLSMAVGQGPQLGHNVIFEDADAITQYSGFFASSVLDPEGIPTLFAP